MPDTDEKEQAATELHEDTQVLQGRLTLLDKLPDSLAVLYRGRIKVELDEAEGKLPGTETGSKNTRSE